jgi:hypothetical protein
VKFYVASHVTGKERVRAIHRRLREAGHEITVDWTSYEAVPSAERETRPERVREIAVRDLAGVRNCDVFVLLAEPPDGRAMYAELGVAIALSLLGGAPRVYVLGEDAAECVFFYHPAVKRVCGIDEVLADLG